jgi:hypothetical protein
VYAAAGVGMRPQQAVVSAPILNRSDNNRATTHAGVERRAGGSSVVGALAVLSLLAMLLYIQPGLSGPRWATTLLQKLRMTMGFANPWR